MEPQWVAGATRATAPCSISSSSRRPLTRSATRRPTGPRGYGCRSPACADCRAGCSISGSAAMAENAIAQFRPLDRPVVAALANATHGDPFSVLGPHESDAGPIVRAFLPGARRVDVLARADRAPFGRLEAQDDSGLFEGPVRRADLYLLRIEWPGGMQETEDPYAFGLLLGDIDLHLFNEGRHFQLGETFGAQAMTIGGVPGVRFAVWAPGARRVAVVGDFNAWDARRHPMRVRYPAGVWELFVPRLGPGERYKHDIIGPDGMRLPLKAAPVARQTEPPPATASVVADPRPYRWHDADWMATRGERQAPNAPISIHEVHLDSWFRGERARAETAWDDAARRS